MAIGDVFQDRPAFGALGYQQWGRYGQSEP